MIHIYYVYIRTCAYVPRKTTRSHAYQINQRRNVSVCPLDSVSRNSAVSTRAISLVVLVTM